MKVLLLASASILALSSASFAADLIVADEPGIVHNDSFDWSGFYVGVNAGVAQGTSAHPFTLSAPDPESEEEVPDLIDIADGSIDVTAGGFVGGLQAGYNVQMDGFVIGIEGDVQGSSYDGRISLDATDLVGFIGDPGDTASLDAGTKLDWFSTLRGRAGATFDRALVYATAGVAFGHTTSSINASINGEALLGDDITSENDRFGWTAGVGIEYALADNVTFKTEYLYTDLGSEEIAAGELFEGLSGTLNSDVAFHTVRAGLNFRF